LGAHLSCLLTGDDGGYYRFQRLPPHRVAVIRRGPTQARSERLRGILEKRSNVGRAPAGESTRSTAQNFPPQETEVKPKYKGHLRRTALYYANLAYPPGCIHIEAQNMKRHSFLYSNWIIPAREPHHHDSSAHTLNKQRVDAEERLEAASEISPPAFVSLDEVDGARVREIGGNRIRQCPVSAIKQIRNIWIDQQCCDSDGRWGGLESSC
jgi:hypothetical protein